MADIVMFDLVPVRWPASLAMSYPLEFTGHTRRFVTGAGHTRSTWPSRKECHGSMSTAARRVPFTSAAPFDEVAKAQRAIAGGRMPDRPFVIVVQQYLMDPGSSVGDVHPLYTYAQVPLGYSGDATAALLDQIERFAPASGTASSG